MGSATWTGQGRYSSAFLNLFPFFSFSGAAAWSGSSLKAFSWITNKVYILPAKSIDFFCNQWFFSKTLPEQIPLKFLWIGSHLIVSKCLEAPKVTLSAKELTERPRYLATSLKWQKTALLLKPKAKIYGMKRQKWQNTPPQHPFPLKMGGIQGSRDIPFKRKLSYRRNLYFFFSFF